MELREFKELLYKKLLDRGEMEDDSQTYELFMMESNEFDKPMEIFVEIVNEAVADSMPNASPVTGEH